MPSPSDEHRASPTIVPDRGDMTSPRRTTRHYQGSPGRRPPRVWPLWIFILLLIAGAGLGGWQLWQRLQAQDAQIAKLNQRLDATGSTLDASGESLRGEFDRLRDQLESTQAAVGSLETRVADSRQGDQIAKQFESLQQTDDDLRDLIATLQSSFTALESTGEDERGALAARLGTLEGSQQQQDDRLDSVDETLDRQQQADQKLSDQLTASLETLRQNQQDLSQQVEANDGSDTRTAMTDLQSSLSKLQTRVDTLAQQETPSSDALEQIRRSVTELRQGQTALNAGLESLQSRIGNLPSGASASQIRELNERLGSLEASRAQLTRRVASLITNVSELQRGGG
ncbi:MULTISPECIES: hypothetical protein [Salinicola]|uniref:Uncharacterized protein n=1 Tax=Salinicola socius TaxID=404433 RepID=A0A1Q8SVP3_9GAMM|nr:MULTISPECIES: hypothetical protein [Salinicola]OLO05496.1 hypothetical protein BTW07_03190 [Salinicola socius]